MRHSKLRATSRTDRSGSSMDLTLSTRPSGGLLTPARETPHVILSLERGALTWCGADLNLECGDPRRFGIVSLQLPRLPMHTGARGHQKNTKAATIAALQ